MLSFAKLEQAFAETEIFLENYQLSLSAISQNPCTYLEKFRSILLTRNRFELFDYLVIAENFEVFCGLILCRHN